MMILAIVSLGCSLIHGDLGIKRLGALRSQKHLHCLLVRVFLSRTRLLAREVDRIFFLQLDNLRLELEFVTFLSRYLMLLNVLKVQ